MSPGKSPIPSPFESWNARTCTSYRIASLYQSASSVLSAARSIRVARATRRPPSLIRLEVTLRPHSVPDPEDVRRDDAGVELHVVVRPLPQVPGPREQVVDLIRPSMVDPELVEVEVQEPRLPMLGVEVHHDQDDVLAVLGGLAVGQEMIAVHGVEAQGPVGVQRGVLAPDPIDESDELGQRIGPVQLPVAHLVLLGVEVLLLAGFE